MFWTDFFRLKKIEIMIKYNKTYHWCRWIEPTVEEKKEKKESKCIIPFIVDYSLNIHYLMEPFDTKMQFQSNSHRLSMVNLRLKEKLIYFQCYFSMCLFIAMKECMNFFLPMSPEQIPWSGKFCSVQTLLPSILGTNCEFMSFSRKLQFLESNLT